MKEGFSDLKWRVAIHSGVVAVSAFLLYTSPLLIPRIVILLAVLAIVLLANVEFGNFLKQKGIHQPAWLALGFAALWVLLDFAQIMQLEVAPYQIALSATFVFATILFQFRQIEDSIKIVGAQIFGQLYLTLPIALLLNILFLDSTGFQNDGRVWLAYLICVAKSSDIGGYFIGKLYGKRQLAPQISPKKTVEGFVGGLVVSLVISFIFWGFSFFVPKAVFSLNWIEALVLGIVISVIAQIGDLTESLFKRDAKLKDSNSIPAIGGILDVLDSLIFTTPLLLAYLKLVK